MAAVFALFHNFDRSLVDPTPLPELETHAYTQDRDPVGFSSYENLPAK